MIKIGNLTANVGKEKIFIEDYFLKDSGKIYLSVDGRKAGYNIKSSSDRNAFINRLFAIAKRNQAEERLSKTRLATIWRSYADQYKPKKVKAMPQNTALKKITTRAKQLRKKQPGLKWKTAIKKASVEYRQTGKSSGLHDKRLKAKPPGKRKSNTGRTYFERRKNRSDVPGTLTGHKNAVLDHYKKRLSTVLLCHALATKKSGTTGKKHLAKIARELKTAIKRYQ